MQPAPDAPSPGTSPSWDALDTTSLLVRVPARVCWRLLEAHLQARGFTLGWTPLAAELPSDITIGEILSRHLAGLRSSLYGDPVACCVSIEAHRPDGTRVTTLTVPRSAAGPDWRHALLGARDAIGSLERATLRIALLPERVEVLAFRFTQPLCGLRALAEARHAGAVPAIALLSIPGMPGPDSCTLLLTFEGQARLTSARAAIARRIAQSRGGELLETSEAQSLVQTLERSLETDPTERTDGEAAMPRHPHPGWLWQASTLRFSADWQTLENILPLASAAGAGPLAITDVRHASALLCLPAAVLDPAARAALTARLGDAGGVSLETTLADFPLGRLLLSVSGTAPTAGSRASGSPSGSEAIGRSDSPPGSVGAVGHE